jgi:Protein of unknown function (DUF1203)
VAFGVSEHLSYMQEKSPIGKTMSFQIHALPHDQFDHLFTMSDSELANERAIRMAVTTSSGYPCRVSLSDANIGETVILVNFEHQAADSPYRAAHAIFVRENIKQAKPEIDVVPKLFDSRLVSIRAFDDKHHIVQADVVDGSYLKESIQTIFQDTKIEYLHLHNAKPGCYLARVTRT